VPESQDDSVALEPLSPELVLVSPPEVARIARRLPPPPFPPPVAQPPVREAGRWRSAVPERAEVAVLWLGAAFLTLIPFVLVTLAGGR